MKKALTIYQAYLLSSMPSLENTTGEGPSSARGARVSYWWSLHSAIDPRGEIGRLDEGAEQYSAFRMFQMLPLFFYARGKARSVPTARKQGTEESSDEIRRHLHNLIFYRPHCMGPLFP